MNEKANGFLVLSCKPGRSIMIGDVEVMVTNIVGNRVMLGIKAPKEIPIFRPDKGGAETRSGIEES